MFNSISKLFILLLALSSISFGCKFITEGKQKLAKYCPGLKINDQGMTYAYSNGKAFYVIDYNQSSQEAVKAYFENKENGFADEKDGDFYNLTLDDKPVIDKTDNILGKTLRHSKGNTEVIFNVSTRRIIIIENSD